MKVANKHKIYLVEADIMINLKVMRWNKIEEFHPKEEKIWICGTLIELNCRVWVKGKVEIDSTIRMYIKDI